MASLSQSETTPSPSILGSSLPLFDFDSQITLTDQINMETIYLALMSLDPQVLQVLDDDS